MNYGKTLYLLSTLMLISSQISSQTNLKRDFEIILEDEIYVEKYDSSIVAKGRYTVDNKVYRSDRRFIYDYYYQALNGKKYKFKALEVTEEMDFQEREKAWQFVSIDSLNENTIDLILLGIETNSNDILYTFPGFNQSVIAYDYLLRDGSQALNEGTGLIENEKNIWLHPPRSKMFRILELNPFPFIQAPYEVGNKWTWTLNNIRGTSWGDERWKTWEGIIESTSTYEITDKQFISLPIGDFECYTIQSTASSPLGETYLTAYFNIDIGFVKLDYTNIDSSKLVFEILAYPNGSR